MYSVGTPVWIWVGVALIAIPVVVVGLLVGVDFLRRKPRLSVRLGETVVDLWVRERRLPCMSEAILAPVATDMKMVAGIAKWIRDSTAGRVQNQALAHAPAAPGTGFVGAGGRYRFGMAALAVVMDEAKRWSPETVEQGVAAAIRAARMAGAGTILIPDLTDDLLSQPRRADLEVRRETCRVATRAMLQAIASTRSEMHRVGIWVWRTGVEDIVLDEITQLAAASRAAALPVGAPTA